MAIPNNQAIMMEPAGRIRGDDSFGTARTDLATITRDDYQNYLDTFAPIEDEVLRLSAKPNRDELRRQATEDARRAIDVSKGITQRNLERYGAELTPAQRRELNKEQARAGTLGEISAQNFATRDAMANQLRNLGLSANIGVNAKTQGLKLLGSSAVSEGNRQAAYNQAKTQASATNRQAIGTIAALAIFSDERLKDDITLIGKNGEYNIYKWQWNNIAKKLGITSKPVGVLAQEILLIKPEAVSVNRNGYYMVNYGAL